MRVQTLARTKPVALPACVDVWRARLAVCEDCCSALDTQTGVFSAKPSNKELYQTTDQLSGAVRHRAFD
ncbi:hypothetical protein XAP412_540031 [Xanthomonas phaseoli pv. phaseoli]|uniref:Uncharacterized protein n=1 Tax=Xanthomonas campestris pv. phaseoli TaxID=317013 RepID=A0AB38E3R5_XANCH|nr:hypothetical protein XAP6984_590034 [Xanthomonas phaseoli pv. phaseoli]SON87598.1 hypothetical protein XAP412_540031 [Xanthomonas phaseoli pv. phaseoli]SON91383.1 hypothetical protein XAP7430_550034 [Xanthomonas phaseoli pv. phaseoli]